MFFFAGREIAQAEYRAIEASPSKLRKDLPLFGGLNPKHWTMKALIALWTFLDGNKTYAALLCFVGVAGWQWHAGQLTTPELFEYVFGGGALAAARHAIAKAEKARE